MTIAYMAKISSKTSRYIWIPQDVSGTWDGLYDVLKVKVDDLKIGEVGAAALMHFLALKKSEQIAAVRRLRDHLLVQAEASALAEEHHAESTASVPVASRKPKGKKESA